MEKKLVYVFDDKMNGITPSQYILQDLTRRHSIWIRDVHFKDGQFQCIPWPQANLMGKYFPICEFMMIFNKEFADESFQNAEKMEPKVLELLIYDYFIDGNEGFNFPVDEEIINSPEKFQECLNALYEKFPHLKPMERHEWKLTLTTSIDDEVNLEVVGEVNWEGPKTKEISDSCLKYGDLGYRKLQEFFEVPSLTDIPTTELKGPDWYRVFAAYGNKTAVLCAREEIHK